MVATCSRIKSTADIGCVGEVEVEGAGKAYLHTYIYEYGDDAKVEMTEGERRTLVDGIAVHLLRVLNGHEEQDEERSGEDAHSHIEYKVDIGDGCVLSDSTDEGAHEHRRDGTHQRVEGAADEVEPDCHGCRRHPPG